MLSEDDRTLILLKDYENLSCQELAQMLGITENNVKVRLHRARQKYRRMYLEKADKKEE